MTRFWKESVFMSLVCASIVLLVLSFSCETHGQILNLGRCPRISGMRNFNISRYSGNWYEVEKYWFVIEATASCVSVRYDDNKDGTFGVEINMIEGVTRKKMTNPGSTWYRSRDGTADFTLDLLITQSPIPFHFQYPYLVLDTDYDNYTIKYRCQPLGLLHSQNMWVLSRTKGFTPEIREKIYTFLRRVGLDSGRLRRSNLGTCPD